MQTTSNKISARISEIAAVCEIIAGVLAILRFI